MKGIFLTLIFLAFCFFPFFILGITAREGRFIYVSPSGDDNLGDGSVENPFKTLTNALYYAKPGDTVYLRGGVYPLDVNADVSGTSSRPIVVMSFPGEWAVFDGSGSEPAQSDTPKFRVTGNYLIFKNFEIKHGGSDGFLLTEGASYNIVEHVIVHHCYFAGFEIENGAHHNLLVNCDSYLNFDYGDTNGEHADGFGVKYNVGEGNVLTYCRAWANSDDGYDLWEANSRVVIMYCYAWANGFDNWGRGDLFAGDGNGFKLGPGGHIIHHCIAWHNARRGFDYNDAVETMHIYNNTSYNNPIGYRFEAGRHVLKNNLSFRDGGNSIGVSCIQEANSWQYNGLPDDAFLSYDDSVIAGERNPDGSIKANDFMKPSLTNPFIDAGVDVGLPFYGKAPDIGAVEVRIHRIINPVIPNDDDIPSELF